MNQNTCNNCGSDYYFIDGRRRCLACGAVRSEVGSDKEQELLAAAFALLREAQFDKAKSAFEDILEKHPENAEAYFGRLRARYRISYVATANGKSVPKCPTRSGANLAEDVDYRKAMEYADEEMKAFLRAQEEAIKALCSQSGASKNITHQFTMGEVDRNDELNIEKKRTQKLKKTIAAAISAVFVLLIAMGIGFWSGFFRGYALEFDKNTDGTYSVIGIDIKRETISEITIPSKHRNKPVTSIGSSAFRGCTGLTGITIPDGVTSIGDYAFYGCSRLTSITIPVGVTSIGSSAFEDCSRLTSITIPDGVTSIGSAAFYGCSRLTSITIPDGVTSIDDSAFYGCTGLTSISIPDGVTSIGNYAFYWCTGLTSISIPDSVTSIGSAAFRDCTGLTSISIPDGVTSIGDHAFYFCKGLTSISIPDGVTSIGAAAFMYCRRLTSVTIPDSVTSIGYSAFYDCDSLTAITFTGTTAQWSAISFGSSWISSTGARTVICTDGTVST